MNRTKDDILNELRTTAQKIDEFAEVSFCAGFYSVRYRFGGYESDSLKWIRARLNRDLKAKEIK